MTRDDIPGTSGIDQREQRRKARHSEWSGATLALVFGLFGLLMGRAGMLWIRFDVFAQFSMQFALLAASGALGILMPRFKGLFAGIIFCLSIAAYGAWPYFASAGPEASLQESEKRLRVMHFNIHADHLDNAMAAETIKALDADVVGLVEVTAANQPLLDALKADYPYQAACGGSADCETAILSRVPFTKTSSNFYWDGANFTMITLGEEFGGLSILEMHTTRFPHARAQFRQINTMIKMLESQPRLVVMGDFNATPFSRVISHFAGSLGLKTFTYLPSWPADQIMPQISIDHILGGAGVRAINRQVTGQASGSDHLPVAITLAVNPH